MEKLLASAELPAQALLIDLGTGVIGPVQCRQCHTAVGLDWSLAMLERALKFNSKGLYIVGNSLYLPLKPACADIITAVGLTEYIDDPSAWLKETVLALKPAGYLILTTSPRNKLNRLRRLYNPKLHLRSVEQWRTTCAQFNLELSIVENTPLQAAMLFRATDLKGIR